MGMSAAVPEVAAPRARWIKMAAASAPAVFSYTASGGRSGGPFGLAADGRHRELAGRGPVQHAAEHTQLVTAADQCRARDPRAHTVIIRPTPQAAQRGQRRPRAQVRASPYLAGPARRSPAGE
jgi:hypothetical protein